MSQLAIRVQSIGKEYRIGAAQKRKDNIREAITSAMIAPIKRTGQLLRGQAYGAADLEDSIWALDDVTFDVNHGEVLGIIGRNGAGKSTLLKILSRITTPTTGEIDIYGRVGALLEVGTGFHQELTGRENIYLNGAILGMTNADIEQKFDEIVDFSGVEKFIDTPVKYYSSGMRLRLGFAVAAHLEPEILIVDEVLAVGDAEFQKKCLGKMSDVAGEGRTVLFVSHNMAAMATMCQRIIWLNDGKICMDGEKDNVISAYLRSNGNEQSQAEMIWPEGISNPDITELKLYRASLMDESGEISMTLDATRPSYLELEYEITRDLSDCRVGIMITNIQGIDIFSTFDADHEEYAGVRSAGRYISRCELPGNLLPATEYFVTINMHIPNVKRLFYQANALSFSIVDPSYLASRHPPGRRPGILRPLLNWTTQNVRMETELE